MLKEKINNIITLRIKLWIAITILSLTTLVFGITTFVLYEDGSIRIASPTTNKHKHIHQGRMYGKLDINMWTVKGVKIIWKHYKCGNLKQIKDTLNDLHPASSYFSKIVYDEKSELFWIIYPTFVNKNNKKVLPKLKK